MTAKMKAIVRTRYGSPDVLAINEVGKPVPSDGQVLVRVQATSLNVADHYQLRSRPLLIRILSGTGLLRPKDPLLGADLAGQVEAVGRTVTRFRVGDEVFGTAAGAFAEYVCAREDRLALKPANLSFEACAAVPIAALTALQALRDQGRIQSGQQVLIQGASGGVGTFAVQIAKTFGAEVSAVCSPRHLEQARAIGADHVVDYTQEDFTKRRQTRRQRYDLIVGVNGYHPLSAYRRALRTEGTYVMVGASTHLFRALFQVMVLGPVLSRLGRKKTSFFIASITQQDLEVMKDLLEAGKVVPVIDRVFPLAETTEAFRYLEEGHATGKVVITV
jgi:NADPH:quinone reductase-like Zn-dependent oxidoreductase